MMARIPYSCGWVILGAVAWAAIWELTPLYVGEVISVWAFGGAWLLKSRDLWAALGHAVKSSDTRQSQGRGLVEERQPGSVP